MRKFLSLMVLSVVLFTAAFACDRSEAAESHVHFYQNPQVVTPCVAVSSFRHHRYEQNKTVAACSCGRIKFLDSFDAYVEESHAWVVTSSGIDANGNIYYIAHCRDCFYDATFYLDSARR